MQHAVFIFFSFFLTSLAWSATRDKIDIPLNLPEVSEEGAKLYLPDSNRQPRALTINAKLQNHLTKYIRDRGNPVAAVVVAEVATGRILAMAEGRPPKLWNGQVNSNLHAQFPAASIFKTVVAGAAFDLFNIEPDITYGLDGGCAEVRPTGVWLNDVTNSIRNSMSLYRAYGHSCNGFFAKVGVNSLGLKTLIDYANKFGWNGDIDTDFNFDKSPLNAPSLRSSSVHAVGRFAAGFGAVGLSPVHAAWIMNAIANNGIKKPLLIQENSPLPALPPSAFSLAAVNPDHIMVSASAAQRLRQLMIATVSNGTATFAFRRGKYRKLKDQVGGKTGTLTGQTPFGVTTWFAGLMPVDHPKVVVAAVVVLEDLWHIKGPNLAAEAFWAYNEYVDKPQQEAQKAL